VVAAGWGQYGGEAKRRRRQQMVQTFSWTHFNKPIDINGGKCDWRGEREGGTAEKNILVHL